MRLRPTTPARVARREDEPSGTIPAPRTATVHPKTASDGYASERRWLLELGDAQLVRALDVHDAWSLVDKGELERALAASRRTPAAHRGGAYATNIARHTPVLLAMMREVLNAELAGERRVVFLGRGADLLYEAAQFLCLREPKLAPLRARLVLMDFARRLVPSGHDDDEAQLGEHQALLQRYLTSRGIASDEPVLLVDTYRSGQGLSTRALKTLREPARTDYVVLCSGANEEAAHRDFARAHPAWREQALAAARFFSHEDLRPPHAYAPGRHLREDKHGMELLFTAPSGKVSLRYARVDAAQHWAGKAAFLVAALACSTKGSAAF